MTLILSGTNGLSDVNGSAAAPAITGTDTDTGVFFGTNTVSLSTNGTERVTLDASGNLGIGTTSPGNFNGVSFASPIVDVLGSIQVRDGGANGVAAIQFGGTTYRKALIYSGNGTTDPYLAFATTSSGSSSTSTERARIDSSGNLLVGTTSTIANAVLVASKSVADYAVRFVNSNASPFGLVLNYSAVAPNSTSSEFLRCVDSSVDRMLVRSNGGIANYSANNVNLSDERTKTDIQDAGSYLAKICAIPVRTFKYKDQTDDLLNLGCIAQEVEAVAPELVDVSGFGETPEDGVPLKAIYQTDLQYALMKCIQEMKTIIDQQAERIAALEAK